MRKNKPKPKTYTCLKKIEFDGDDEAVRRARISLSQLEKGSNVVFETPLCKNNDPFEIITDWTRICIKDGSSKLNSVLMDMEIANRSKLGPRSIAKPWKEGRHADLKQSFITQEQMKGRKVPFKSEFGEPTLVAASVSDVKAKIKLNKSAGYPFMCRKKKAAARLYADFDKYLDRKYPAQLLTRTQEGGKTRNIWGMPFAHVFFEMFYFLPLLKFYKRKDYCAANRSPEDVDNAMTKIIKFAMSTGRKVFSSDLIAFDNNLFFEIIIDIFNEFASHFVPSCKKHLDWICKCIYSIPIVTPSGIWRGNHGSPSGSGFTNLIATCAVRGVACVCNFIIYGYFQIQGDDAVFCVTEDELEELKSVFKHAGFKLNMAKSHVADNYAVFCQMLYHYDYIHEDGVIRGIYPTFRALNRLLYQEHFSDFKKSGLSGRTYYGLRTISILENCKNHPLFPELVRFIMKYEKYDLDISPESLTSYIKFIVEEEGAIVSLNGKYGSNLGNIANFETFKLVQSILLEKSQLENVN